MRGHGGGGGGGGGGHHITQITLQRSHDADDMTQIILIWKFFSPWPPPHSNANSWLCLNSYIITTNDEGAVGGGGEKDKKTRLKTTTGKDTQKKTKNKQ